MGLIIWFICIWKDHSSLFQNYGEHEWWQLISSYSSDAESQSSPTHENLIEELPQVCNYALIQKNSHLNMYEQSDQQQLTIPKLQKELKELQWQVSGKQCRIPTQSSVDQGSKSAKKKYIIWGGYMAIWRISSFVHLSLLQVSMPGSWGQKRGLGHTCMKAIFENCWTGYWSNVRIGWQKIHHSSDTMWVNSL